MLHVSLEGYVPSGLGLSSRHVVYDVGRITENYTANNAYHCIFNVSDGMHKSSGALGSRRTIYNIDGDCRNIGGLAGPRISSCVFNVSGDVEYIETLNITYGCTFRTSRPDVYERVIGCFFGPFTEGCGDGCVLEEVAFLNENRVQLVSDITQYFKGGEKYGK